jgi:hypothetical protein
MKVQIEDGYKIIVGIGRLSATFALDAHAMRVDVLSRNCDGAYGILEDALWEWLETQDANTITRLKEAYTDARHATPFEWRMR